MPTFTTIALDRLIEAGAPKTMKRGVPNGSDDAKIDRSRSLSTVDRPNVPRGKLEKATSVPNGKLEQRNGSPAVNVEKKHHWTRISPALYATPEPTPVPDSPSSFPPSPYIVNHKRRGPRLLKSYSEDDVAIRTQDSNEKKLDDGKGDGKKVGSTTNGSCAPEEAVDLPEDDAGASTNTQSLVWDKSSAGDSDIDTAEELVDNELINGSVTENGATRSVASSLQRDSEADDFFDPQDSLSVKSNSESEINFGAERSLNNVTQLAEFYDAWEELSSEGGPQLPLPDIETELREIRLSLMMEMENRKQAEETLKSLRAKWLKIREELSVVGLNLPADPVAAPEDGQLNERIEELSIEREIARFVSYSIGRGTAKAEVEMEMETEMELKNFEIARLLDRLHYYEAVNHQMSQRNQETIESSRRLRQQRKRRQRWIWGSAATVVTIGAAVLAWSSLPAGNGPSSSSSSHAPEANSESSH